MGGPSGPPFEQKHKETKGFGAFRGLGLAPFWSPFGIHLGLILGPILEPFWAPFEAPFGSFLVPFRDFQENLDFRLASRPQTPSDLVFVPGARKFLSPDPLLKNFLKYLLKGFLLKIFSEKIFKPW